MKRVGWAILTFLFFIGCQSPVYAVGTIPSDGIEPKVNGPLLITAYSFSGHSLRYVQLFNASDAVVRLDGWRVAVDYLATQQVYVELAGNIAPRTYVTVANSTTVPTATFVFTDPIPAADPLPTTISLLAPSTLNFNNEIVTPSVTSSTPRVGGTPATFYFARNTSTTTGNYLSTFTAFVPGQDFNLLSDGLYVAPNLPGLRIVEIYPNARDCTPFETDPTCADYVKVLNDTEVAVELSLFRLRTGAYGAGSTSSNTTPLNGWLQAGHTASFAISLSSSGSWVWLEDTYGTTRYESTLVSYPSTSGHDREAWSRDAQNTWRWTIYPTPGDSENTFPPEATVNKCEGLALNEVAANVATEDQYIELRNRSEIPIDLVGCVLQTNRSTTSQYVFGTEQLAPGSYRTVYVKDTELTLTKTTKGTVYVLSSDLMTETDSVTYENLDENTSWAEVSGDWIQTYAVTPNIENVAQDYPACDPGYARNIETGFCNKIQVSSVQLADCGAGKERNPDTNRCKAIISTASLLTPCASNQVRNPATNRCSAVQSVSLKPCAANQERNPDTNRCRNKTTTVTSDFPVQAVAQTGEATLGWWAFGGVGTLAVGYAGWEWRREVLSVIKKVTGFIAGRF